MLLSMLAIYKVSQTTEKDTFLKQVCFFNSFWTSFFCYIPQILYIEVCSESSKKYFCVIRKGTWIFDIKNALGPPYGFSNFGDISGDFWS